MAIMTTSKVTQTESTGPKMTLPFLWKDASGTIHIRQRNMHDIPIGGVIQLENVGSMRLSNISNEQAWRNRLSDDVSVTLRNFFS